MRLDVMAVVAAAMSIAHVVVGAPDISPDRKTPSHGIAVAQRAPAARPAARTAKHAKPATAKATKPSKAASEEARLRAARQRKAKAAAIPCTAQVMLPPPGRS